MSEQQQQKKKKKQTLLYIDFECLPRDEIIKTLAEIRKRIYNIFKQHIGEENAITPYDLFTEVIGVTPNIVDIYKRSYWWNIIKSILRNMRSDGELFIINKKKYLFVLKEQHEADDFKATIDRDIKHLENVKRRADEWVLNRKWEGLL